MIKDCPDCKERMMIVSEGFPKYTHGSYVIYGCPTCGRIIYEYDNSNCEGNPIEAVYDPKNISQYMVSN